MKKVIVLTLLILDAMLLAAQNQQPIITGYAWHQTSLKAVKSTPIAGENEDKPGKLTSFNGSWYIYLEYKKSACIVPYRIWVEGKPFRVEYTKHISSPVIISKPGVGFNRDSDTLVGKTNNKVMQVSPLKELTILSLTALPPVKVNAVPGKIIIEYYWRAKRYCYIIEEIKISEAIPLQ